MKKILILIITLFSILGCNKNEIDNQINLKLAHGLSETHPVHIGMLKFMELVETKTDGDIKIQIFPNGQLGQERELIELLQAGAIDLTKASASPIEGFVKEYAIFSMPYLFDSYNHFLRVLKSPVGEEFLSMTEKNGFVGLGYFTAGTRNFYGSKPIETPEDLKGLKIRVQPSNTAIKMVEHLGGTATPLSYGELYTALQQRVVDGAENNISAITTDRHGEVSKFYSYDEHTIVPDVFFISNSTWKKLNDKQKEILKKSAEEAFDFQVALWDEMEKIQIEQAKEMNVKFVYPDKKPFQEMVQPMYEELMKNEKMASLINSIKNTN
ncbi:TRAP transporter substrate-binding protein [Cetobacterium sp.]|uniref:TRAP transporter substrate-binding protein n=1 Tax=Cetobacterium sp. TaxID=2071632 RepID=UPI003F31BF65